MKTIARLCILLGATLSLASCIPSLHPVFTDEDIDFDEALVGEWSEDWEKGESAVVWDFKKSGNGDYTMILKEKGKSGKFNATLFKIGEHRYLDLFPDDLDDDNLSLFFKWHLLPVHTFLRVKQIEPSLQMAFLNTNKLEEIVEADPEALTMQEVSERMVMTGPTEELQAFLKNYDKEQALFDKFSDLTKKQD